MKKHEARINGRPGYVAMVKTALLCTVILFQCISVNIGEAAQTAGGVNWLDPAAYQKPAFVPLTVPDESAATKYYVDLAAGNDSNSCTASSAPCKTMNGLAGKAYSPLRGGGTAGAYVYLRGNGKFTLTSSFSGASGKEIVIKPWPGDSTIYYFTADGCASSSNPNTFGANSDPSSVQYVILDGGPNLQFVFRGANASGCNVNFDGALSWNGSNNTLYRIQITGNGQNNNDLIGMANGTGNFTNLRMINCELHDAKSFTGDPNSDQNYGLYGGGATSCSAGCSGGATVTNAQFISNIWRDLNSLGIQIEPRCASTGLVISGNAFHDLGHHSCGGKWYCRPAIAVTDSCGGNNSGYIISNNLIWSTASSCMWLYGGTGSVFNNSCYSFAEGTGSGSGLDTYNSAIAGYGGSLSGKTVENNIMYSPYSSSFANGSPTMSYNICSGSCGSSSKTWSSSTWLSTDQANSNFMKIGTNSNAYNSGLTISSVTTDYAGVARTSGTAYDIGAIEYAPSTVPSAPIIINIQ